MIERDEDPWVDWIAAEARRPVALDPAAKARLLELVRAERAPVRERSWRQLFEIRAITLSPLASLATAAGLVGIGVLAGMAHRGGNQRLPLDID